MMLRIVGWRGRLLLLFGTLNPVTSVLYDYPRKLRTLDVHNMLFPKGLSPYCPHCFSSSLQGQARNFPSLTAVSWPPLVRVVASLIFHSAASVHTSVSETKGWGFFSVFLFENCCVY